MKTEDGTPGISLDLRAHALANISDGSVITDAAQNILHANAAFCEMSGYSEQELLGRNCRLLQGEASDPLAIAAIRYALASGETYRGSILNYSKDGRAFWNSLTVTAIRDERGTVSHYASVQRDVTELIDLQDRARSLLELEREQRKTTQSLLRVARRVNDLSTLDDVSQAICDAANELCDTSRSAVVLWDDSARTLAVAAQSGWTGDLAARVLAIDRTTDETPLAPPEGAGEPSLVSLGDSETLDALLREFDVEVFVSMPIAARGKTLGVVAVAWPSSDRPQKVDGSLAERLTGLAGLAATALENARLLSEARWNATHDPLTSLPNRTVLEEVLGKALEAASSTCAQVAVLYCDVDRFKLTNDALGHAAGDVMLERVGSVLQTSVRSRDIVARVGGDEFAIVLPFVTGIQDAHDVADRIRSALAAPFQVDGRNIFVKLSIGIAISDQRFVESTPDDAAQLLIRAADADMYREKTRKSGSSARPPKTDGLRLDTDLHGAVDRGEIEAFYQPQIDLATNEVVGVEALARWNHPELGLVEPEQFIRFAEDNGVINEIGESILDQACSAAEQWEEAGHPLEVSVNVSVVQLMRDGFASEVEQALKEHDIPADALTIEVTESRLIADVPGVAQELARVRDMGTGVSIDDFGTGQASLTQLLGLPVTELKIDQSFVRKRTNRGSAFISAMVGLSRELDLRVVAEGVSTDQDIGLVRDLGCDRAQGYGIAEPMSGERFGRWRQERPAPTEGGGRTA